MQLVAMPAVYYCVFVSGMSRHAPWGAFDLTHPRSPGSMLLSLMQKGKKSNLKSNTVNGYTAMKIHSKKNNIIVLRVDL